MNNLRKMLLQAAAARPFGLLAMLFKDRSIATHLIDRIREKQVSMVSRRRLLSLYERCSAPDLPAGALVECGVARGGCIAVMSFCSKGHRPVWGFDSFGDMPPLTPEDEAHGEEWVGVRCSGPDGLRGALDNLARFRVLKPWVHIIPGWFEDTLPSHVARIGTIAVLRLDNDWYKSTRYCLDRLYGSVAPGGVIIIDDYHSFVGCRKAVDEFRAQHAISAPMITTEGYSEAYWEKPL